MKNDRSVLSFLILSLFIFTVVILGWLFLFDDTIRFSKKSGFYDEAFDLRIRTKPGLDIYYTLDGSEPTHGSPHYEGALRIDDPSDNPNIFSARTDTSGFFVTEFSGVDIYKAPDYNVDKCVVIRAASFDKEGAKVDEAFASYWVGMDEKEGYDGLYTVSLTADPKDLFGKERGIYVLGGLFDEYLAEKKVLSSYVREWNANYNETGRDWERPAHFVIFDRRNKKVYESDAGVRIQGKGSRKNNQKSLGFYARQEYGATDRFETSLFGRIEGMHKIKLNNGGNDEFVKLKDYLVMSIIAENDLEIGTLSMIPASVFINGEYWGVYYIMEAINADYVSFHYGIDPDNIILINAEELTHGEDGDKEEYYDIVYDFAKQYGAETPDLYEHICKYYIDIDSFIDFYATEVYIGNEDWPLKNSACWRARKVSDADYNDGLWRYIIYDVNMAGTMTDPASNTLAKAIDDDALFAALMTNPEFQQRFKDKIDELEKGAFSWDNVHTHFGAWRDLMEEPLVKSSIRFSGDRGNADLGEREEELEYFFKNRGREVRAQLHKIIDGAK